MIVRIVKVVASIAAIRGIGLTVAIAGPPVEAVRPMKQPTAIEFRLAEPSPGEGLTTAEVVGTEEVIYLHSIPFVTTRDVDEVRVAVDSLGLPAVRISLTKAGGEKARRVTGQHLQKPVAIVVGGKVVSAPVIRDVIGAEAEIRGAFTWDEAERMAKAIAAGVNRNDTSLEAVRVYEQLALRWIDNIGGRDEERLYAAMEAARDRVVAAGVPAIEHLIPLLEHEKVNLRRGTAIALLNIAQADDVRDKNLLDTVLLRMVEDDDIKTRSNLYHVADTIIKNRESQEQGDTERELIDR